MNGKSSGRDPAVTQESFTELLKQLANSSTTIVRNEIALAIQGIFKKAQALKNGAILMAAAALFAMLALMAFVAALIVWIASYIGAGWSAVVIGCGLIIGALILATMGSSRLKSIPK